MDPAKAIEILRREYAVFYENRRIKMEPNRFSRGVAILAQYADLHPNPCNQAVAFFGCFDAILSRIKEEEVILLGQLGWSGVWEEGDIASSCWSFDDTRYDTDAKPV